MGYNQGDFDEGTILPPARGNRRLPESQPRVERPIDPVPSRPVSSGSISPAGRVERPISPPAAFDESDYPGTIPPPGHRPKPVPAAKPAPSPAMPQLHKPNVSPSPSNPWKEEESDTAGPPQVKSPASPGFLDNPWTSTGTEPPRQRVEPKINSYQSESLKTGLELDPKTPQGFPNVDSPVGDYRSRGASDFPSDDLHTIAINSGLKIEAPQKFLRLQFSDGGGHWKDLEQVKSNGHVVGKASFQQGTSAVEFLATEHLRLTTEGDQVFVEEGQTLNGVYRKVPPGQSVELKSGTRFQVGQHVIEFQLPEATRSGESILTRNEENFRWRRLEPLAYLVFIGPDGRPDIRFPLTRATGTVIGREGDISLTGDTWASRLHARVYQEGDRFFLEDRNSMNGTFVKIEGRTPVRPASQKDKFPGDILLAGIVLLRLIES